MVAFPGRSAHFLRGQRIRQTSSLAARSRPPWATAAGTSSRARTASGSSCVRGRRGRADRAGLVSPGRPRPMPLSARAVERSIHSFDGHSEAPLSPLCAPRGSRFDAWHCHDDPGSYRMGPESYWLSVLSILIIQYWYCNPDRNCSLEVCVRGPARRVSAGPQGGLRSGAGTTEPTLQ